MAGRGFFLSFEGIDGSGKTTQIGRLAAELRKRDLALVLAQEPGGTRVGRLIRKILLDSANTDLDPTAEMLLYFASRVQNLAEVIRPALSKGAIVISDRFTDATVAYQGHGRALGKQRVLQLSEFACDGIEPDLTLWLDVNPVIAVTRARARNAFGAFDESLMESQSMSFFSVVREGYAALHNARPDRVRRIDANHSEDHVARTVLGVVLPALQARGLVGA